MSDHSPDILSSRLRIGLEIHVELATRTRMFSRAPNVAHPDYFDAEPNTLVDPVVAALPGALPVMNRRAVEMSIMVGIALNCEISRFSKWDRKNYFYPDLPKGYQISQYDLPLCRSGWFEVSGRESPTTRIGIIRAHLEEDTGKLGHDLPGGGAYEGSLVDLNRAGTPLLEIVTEPDFESADDVVTFAQELRSICRFLEATEGDMQRGHMRIEPNVNVIITTEDSNEHATPIVEIKNLNSFRAIHKAIVFEHDRQIKAWQKTGEVMGPGAKRTRGWDDVNEVTVLQREKEDVHDYRYFPEPDLIPVVVDDQWLGTIHEQIPELPLARRRRYFEQYGLSADDAATLTEDRPVCCFFEACLTAIKTHTSEEISHFAKHCAKLLTNSAAKLANECGCRVDQLGISPEQVAELLALRQENTIGSSAAEKLFGLLCQHDGDAESVANQHGLVQISDASQLDTWVQQAIEAEPHAADDVRSGKGAAIGRLMGAVMRISGGQADAKSANAILREVLAGDDLSEN